MVYIGQMVRRRTDSQRRIPIHYGKWMKLFNSALKHVYATLNITELP